ncbi:MAG: 23S rRNA methyltransferase [Rhodospirillaceae bacterium]|nr:23S rRNA methyltransferase [Rhodospirillaceae bacterium]|tara:strand:+ start:1493 stop:2188 length:696 start_codon:yes stop_codon:yes gene_type:complete
MIKKWDTGIVGNRSKKVKLKTARGRSVSSQRWLSRQLNDPYVKEAKRLGLRSRSAFKLIQLDEKFNLLRPGQRIVDLGAAPGGWTQVAAQQIKDTEKNGKVIGFDVLPIEPITGAELVQGDFMVQKDVDTLSSLLDGTADLVLSDMAAPTTGHASTDHIRTVALCEAAYEFARETLSMDGVFVAKVFKGGSEQGLLARMKREFKTVRHVKPKASRPESPETYVIAQGYKGI